MQTNLQLKENRCQSQRHCNKTSSAWWFKKQVIAQVKSKDGGAAYLSGSLQDELATLQLQEEALLRLRSEKNEETQIKWRT